MENRLGNKIKKIHRGINMPALTKKHGGIMMYNSWCFFRGIMRQNGDIIGYVG